MGKTHVSLKHKTQSSTGALAPFSSAGSSCCSVCFICHHPVVLQLTQVRSQIFFSCDNLAHIQLAIDPKRRRWEKSTERTILLLKAAKSIAYLGRAWTCFKCHYSKHSNVTYDATMDTPRPGAPARPHHWGPWAAHPGHWLAPGRQMTWTVLEDGVQVQYMNSAQN